MFALLLKHELRIRLKKCSFMQPRVELSGHCIDKERIHTDERKVQTIRDAHSPRSRKELRSFLEMASNYQRFIRNFAKIARPLSKKISEKVEFEWTLPMQKSFNMLKQALTNAPVLAYPDFSKPFLVVTDASSAEVREFLLQLDENGKEHPINYASRSLNEAEKNYSTYERERLAIVFVFKKFRHYLLFQKFKLFVDHEALKDVINNRYPHGRIARWISIFSEYDFQVLYRSSPRNANANYLSRPVAKDNLVSILDIVTPNFQFPVDYPFFSLHFKNILLTILDYFSFFSKLYLTIYMTGL